MLMNLRCSGQVRVETTTVSFCFLLRGLRFKFSKGSKGVKVAFGLPLCSACLMNIVSKQDRQMDSWMDNSWLAIRPVKQT